MRAVSTCAVQVGGMDLPYDVCRSAASVPVEWECGQRVDARFKRVEAVSSVRVALGGVGVGRVGPAHGVCGTVCTTAHGSGGCCGSCGLPTCRVQECSVLTSPPVDVFWHLVLQSRRCDHAILAGPECGRRVHESSVLASPPVSV